jgi:protein-tyrosine phosphatase
MKKILFVCTGNYFRSRFAEIYFNEKIKGKNLEWTAFSRGFDISNMHNKGFISKFVIKNLKELKISLSSKLNLPLLVKLEDLLQAEKIIALSEDEHRPYVKKMFPDWEQRFTFWNIRDLNEEDATTSLIKLKFELDKLINDICT